MRPTTTSPTASRGRRALRVLLGLATAITITTTLTTLHPTPAHATTSPWLKPVLGGLLDRQHAPNPSWHGAVDGYVAEIAWAALQPTPNTPRTPQSVHMLLSAGYTTSLEQACQHQQIDTHKLWTRPRSGLSFNPYQHVTT